MEAIHCPYAPSRCLQEGLIDMDSKLSNETRPGMVRLRVGLRDSRNAQVSHHTSLSWSDDELQRRLDPLCKTGRQTLCFRLVPRPYNVGQPGPDLKISSNSSEDHTRTMWQRVQGQLANPMLVFGGQCQSANCPYAMTSENPLPENIRNTLLCARSCHKWVTVFHRWFSYPCHPGSYLVCSLGAL